MCDERIPLMRLRILGVVEERRRYRLTRLGASANQGRAPRYIHVRHHHKDTITADGRYMVRQLTTRNT